MMSVICDRPRPRCATRSRSPRPPLRPAHSALLQAWRHCSTMAQTAVVTGASGYLVGYRARALAMPEPGCLQLPGMNPCAWQATEIVKQLLAKGYNVRGTIRSKSAVDKYQHLERLSDTLPGTLTLYEADLLSPGAFDSVAEGADVVFHTASPFSRCDIGKWRLLSCAQTSCTAILSSLLAQEHERPTKKHGRTLPPH